MSMSAHAAPPDKTPEGYSYPLDDVSTEEDFAALMMSGGCWLAGLPGFPRYNGRHVHAGIDLRTKLGSTVYAVAPGVVDPWSDVPHRGYGAGWSMGQVMIIRGAAPGGQSYLVLYGHTVEHLVRGGETVVAGQPVARIGPWLEEQGGPHLHLTVRLGELPTQGWGTPTWGDIPSRPGAETVRDPVEVVRLGYRDPRMLLRGELNRELHVGVCPDGEMVAPLVERYRAAYRAVHCRLSPGGLKVENALGFPARLSSGGFALVQRTAGGCTQTLELPGGEEGALMTSECGDSGFAVCGPMWSAYQARGGVKRFGYPISEAETDGKRQVQRFETATLVIETDGELMIVPTALRRLP